MCWRPIFLQVSSVQKLETKQIQLRETYERQKLDVQVTILTRIRLKLPVIEKGYSFS